MARCWSTKFLLIHFNHTGCSQGIAHLKNVRNVQSYCKYILLNFHFSSDTYHFNHCFHSAMQHGSFPLISPLNETFPPFFHLKRTYLTEISLLTDNSTTLFKIPNPMPGSWFAMAFLGDYVDDKITQKVRRRSRVIAIWFSCRNCSFVGHWHNLQLFLGRDSCHRVS